MFNTFCVIYDIPNYLPFSMSNIALFVSNLYTQSFPPKTILTYLSAIGYLHKVAGHSDPAQLFFIQRLVAGAYQLGNTFDIRLPITHQILIQILDSIPQALTDKYDQKLYAAIFLFAFSTFARIRELVCSSSEKVTDVIQLSDVFFAKENGVVARATVCFKKYKHNSACLPKYITFSHGDCGKSSIEAILWYSGLRSAEECQFFLTKSGAPVMRSCIDKTLYRCLSIFGLDSKRYKGHSFRIGTATSATDRGLSDAQIRTLGRCNSNVFQNILDPLIMLF